MAANKLGWNARIIRLKNTLAHLDNSSNLTAGQQYLRKGLRAFLGSEDAKMVAAIKQMGDFPELDEIEKAVRQALKVKPVEGVGSEWDDEEQEDSGQGDGQQDSQDSDDQRDDRRREDDKKKQDRDKDKDRTQDKQKKGKDDPKKRRDPKQERPGDKKKPPRTEKPELPKGKPGGTPKPLPTTAGAGGAGAAGTAGAAGGAAAGGAAAGGAAAGGAAAGGAAGGGIVAFFASPPGLVTLAIILILAIGVGLYMYFTQKNKVISAAGGSWPRLADLDDPEQAAALEKVRVLINPPEGEPTVIIREPAQAEDLIGFTEENGERRSKADYRILTTIGYLADQGWGKIVIGLTSSNGPDITRRHGLDSRGAGGQIDANSAYATGQAIGIVALGQTSLGLTACLNLQKPIPVEIAWQETAIENRLRPLHEQLEVNVSQAYRAMVSSKIPPTIAGSESRPLFGGGGWGKYTGKTTKYLGEFIAALESNRSSNPAAIQYAREALADINAALGDGTQAAYPQMRSGLAKAFRALQIANTWGWEGDKTDGCRLWKAYEARDAIRRLDLQILRMPVALKTGEHDFNPDFVVRQLIVFSPEDDLDNGLPDTDIFPFGAIAVDVGGISYDNTGRDGKITEADNNFLALPQDNGILSKAFTIFASRGDGGNVEEGGGEVAGTGEARQEFDKALDFGYESGSRVSYKNFVHIGF